MFLLYHSEGCNTSEIVFPWCYVNDLHTTHAVVCWVTTPGVMAQVVRSKGGCGGGWFRRRSRGSDRRNAGASKNHRSVLTIDNVEEEIERVSSLCGRCRNGRGKRKRELIKNNVVGGNDTTGGEL
jgi:hypothetical protein